jgi:hypothetical protein
LISNSLKFWRGMDPVSCRAVLTTVLGGYWWEGHRLYEELGQLRMVVEPWHSAVFLAIQLILGLVLQLILVCLTGLVQLGLIEVPLPQPVPLVILHVGLGAVARGELCAVPASWACLDGSYGLVRDPVYLLQVTGAFIMPTHSVSQLLDMAESMTHAWAVPGLDLGLDCVPGHAPVSFERFSHEGGCRGRCRGMCMWDRYSMPVALDAVRFEFRLAMWERDLHAHCPHPGMGQPGGCKLRNFLSM